MRHGIISSSYFTLGGIDFWIDLVDNSYYGKKAYTYYTPSSLTDDCWGINFTKQFRSEQACRTYITKCIKRTCKAILKDIL